MDDNQNIDNLLNDINKSTVIALSKEAGEALAPLYLSLVDNGVPREDAIKLCVGIFSAR